MPLDELRTALHQAVELDEPSVGRGPAAVFARADRARTRQRLTMVVSGIVVVGVGVAALAIDRDGGGASTTAQPPVVSQAASSAASSQSPGQSPGQGPGQGPRQDVPGDVMLNTLLKLLPTGVTTAEPYSQPGFAELILVDQAGSGKIQVNLQPGFNAPVPAGRDVGDDPMDLFSCAKRHDPAGTHCTDWALPDGTLVVLTDGPSEDAGHDRIKRRMADILRPGGTRIVIGTWNAAEEKTNTATRAEPPLTTQQLQAIATDPTWPV